MNNTNLILSIILSIAIIIGWQYFYERPRLNNLAQQQHKHSQEKEIILQAQKQNDSIVTIENSIEETPRIKIHNSLISGSINLIGARIDDMTLLEYKEELNKDQNVRIFAPSNTNESYFAEIGWHSSDSNLKLPTSNTKWVADNTQLTTGSPLKLTWDNGDSVEFSILFTLDEEYMLSIEQEIKNNSTKTFEIKPYGLINRNYELSDKSDSILHKGPIGVVDGELREYSYVKLKEDAKKSFKNVSTNWIGITDKYWLTALIPDNNEKYSVNFNHTTKDKFNKFQVDLLSETIELKAGGKITTNNKLFVGAKKVKLLDRYAKKYDIKLFDRAIDFGWLYLLTKPMFYVLSFFYEIFGNFGLSIMIVTVFLKLAMFTLSTKSSKSMKRLKTLQPEIERIKNQYANDKLRLNQEIMSLYKKEKVNPFSGCLPLLIQIPVFFSIYKVLYVTIEMRHAPFFGWIADLSAADPTSFANLFGLLAFTPPTFLQIGVWPILMSLSMFIQQQVSGNTAVDPVQAQTMKLLPLIFLFMFASFPAGLLIYWTWSNTLSILQQLYVNKYVK
jgi:YidC/Oxa1 family membrane protein insertase